ncbi:helix-turn-helix domain-containing protein [Aeromonas encheleia]|uniref:helix-turn-helix transcriptional regulator n=1 Tax=Aeromonas encheleia TaxID=73010 RepID=UPI001F5665C0|nr:helix-turn-helix domain-containing protein [Aeromonas encheleia]UNP89649.1 helix-turn-helix domain-containing protein [Aeromonas encheleia]
MKGMINAVQLAERLGVSRPTLRRWLASGKLPPPHAVLGQTKLWNERWLTTWLSSQQKNQSRALDQAVIRAEQAKFERESPFSAAAIKKCR